MAKKKHEMHEEHPDERWLVSYSDMITVLMCLFIVLFAMSQVDQNKFSALAQGLAEGFGVNNTIMTGQSNISEEAGSTVVNAPYSQGQSMVAKTAASTAQIKSQALKQAADLAKQQEYGQATAEAQKLNNIAKQIQSQLAKKGLAGNVITKVTSRGLVVSLVSRHAMFQTNLATLTPQGAEVVKLMAPIVKATNQDIEIDGSTNQAKGKPKYYDDDWDLAYSRAHAVLKYFLGEGISENRMQAVSFGHTKPLVSVSQPNSQEINKRVDIVVLSTQSEEVRAMLQQASQQLNKGN